MLLLLIVGVAGFAGPSPARAQEDVELYHSYVQSGGASAITVVYNRENLLPFSPIVDFGAPRIRLEIGDTPTSVAKAAPFDPGLVGAASGLSQILGMPPGLVPPYPLYANAAFPTGPEQATVGISQDDPSGDVRLEGVEGHSEASAERAAAETSVADVDGAPEGLAGVVTVRGAATDGELLHEGRSLQGALRTRLTGVELLGGLVEIGTVETKVQLSMPDPREPPEVATATTTMSDIRIGGIVAVPSDTATQAANAIERINELVSPSGLQLELAVPVEGDDVLGITGLQLTFDGEIQSGERDFLQVSLASAQLSYFSDLFEVPLPPAVASDGSFSSTPEGSSPESLTTPPSTPSAPASSPPVEVGAPETELGGDLESAAPSESGASISTGTVVDMERIATAVGRIAAGLSIGAAVVAGFVIAGRFGFIFRGAPFGGSPYA